MGTPYAFLFLTQFSRRLRMTEKPNPLEDRKETYVTMHEAADYLRVALRTVYRWVEQGRLKVFHVGRGSTRIPTSELERFISENTGLFREKEE
jgi:excisionase family DNA binding protein